MEQFDPSDAQLLAEVPAADAVAVLYERHVDAVFRFAVRRSRNPEDVADLVATVFVELFASAPRYDRSKGDVRPWLLGIAVRCLADQRRAGYRRAELEQRLAASLQFEPDEYEAVEAAIDAARAAPAIERALTEKLTAAERELFLLVAEDGLAVVEAARALGLAAGTGRMRLARARRKLRLAMGCANSNPEEVAIGGVGR
jgi:RNA polymerase sigma-70 factor (ECF subfamily)